MTGTALAAAAEALVGTRFHLHGRDPATGLDCIGVLAAALAAIGRSAALPNGYALRSRALPGLEGVVKECGFAATSGAPLPGDVLLVRAGPCQFHLLIASRDDRFVHSHAGIGRVIASPGPPAWPVVHHWRPLSRNS